MGLEARGYIAVVEIVLYIPILLVSLLLVSRHGFKREAGWVFLLVLSLIRLVGGAVLIYSELSNTTNSDVLVTAFILESVGLSPLLLATLGFLAVVGQHSPSGQPIVPQLTFRILRVLFIAALALAIVGGSDTSSTSSDTVKTGTTLRKIGAILYIIGYVIVAGMHGVYWGHKDQILRHRRTLLKGISAALPFIAIRLLYSVLSSFSPSAFTSSDTTPPPQTSLSKFNAITGEWQIYLVMSLIMEFITVVIYCVVGTTIPLQKEDDDAARGGGYIQESALGRPEYPLYSIRR